MTSHRSARTKGFKGEKEVVDIIVKYFGLDTADVRQTQRSAQGEDLLFSRKARKLVDNFQFEVKRRNKVASARWMDQCKKHGTRKPLVVFREDNKKDWYVMINLKHFLDICKRLNNNG